MRGSVHRYLFSLLLLGQCANAQTVVDDHEVLAADRPEAWAMNYMAATTFMTAFDDSATLPPGHWNVALELGDIPRLSAAHRQVGLGGSKVEDLNKSPVFGRLRLALGLPAGWLAEFGYTPPLTVNGLRAHGLVALAVGHRIVERDAWALSARAFGQHGSVRGDIICPADIAGVPDISMNPYGCQTASRDRVALNYYGADVTAAGGRGDWHWHGGIGIVRTELEVRLDALTFSFRDRTRLTANGFQRYLVAGVGRNIDRRWSVGAEVLYVPLPVRRDPDDSADNDALTSVRLLLRYRHE
jgi:hypothetical protein